MYVHVCHIRSMDTTNKTTETERDMSKDKDALAANEEQAKEWAMDRVMKYARDLIEYQETDTTNDVFRRMQHIGVALAGLMSAVMNYDETVAFFDKEAGQ